MLGITLDHDLNITEHSLNANVAIIEASGACTVAYMRLILPWQTRFPSTDICCVFYLKQQEQHFYNIITYLTSVNAIISNKYIADMIRNSYIAVAKQQSLQ